MVQNRNKIVFINQATGYLTIDIINEFSKHFTELALITGSIRVQDVMIDSKVKLSYITPYNRKSKFKKLVSWIVGSIQIYVLLAFRFRKYERFYFTIPPLAYLMASKSKTPYSILIYDLYPEALLIHGISERGMLYQWWLKKNCKIFSSAYKVFTLSENMKSRILKHCSNSNIEVIANWSVFSGLERINKEANKLIRIEGNENKFIVQYSGNLGSTHNVEVILEVANALKEEEDIIFMIIGRGQKLEDMRKIITLKKLSNCRIVPFRKDDQLFESLCAADIAVVTLDDSIPDISVPSKTYNIMAVGVPIMAITAPSSGVAELIKSHNIGKVFNKDDLEGMCKFILELKYNHEAWSFLSNNSLSAAKNYTRNNARRYVEAYFNSRQLN